MTLALKRGALADVDADMERTSRLPPEGPAIFPTPRHQHDTSTRPNPANDTDCVRQIDPLAQREQVLFRRRTEMEITIARVRMEQFGVLVLDIYRGPCLTDRAEGVIEQFVPLVAIACGQSGFYRMMEEIAYRYAPLALGSLDDIINRALLDWPLYTSPAIGKRWGVTRDQYERLGFTHITPAGWGKRRMEAYRAERRAAKTRATRLATGKTRTPRELSIKQLQPWKLPNAGCGSQAGFYRLSVEARRHLVARARTEASLRR